MGKDGGKSFKELGRIKVFNTKDAHSMPAYANGRLFWRNFSEMVCLKLAEPKKLNRKQVKTVVPVKGQKQPAKEKGSSLELENLWAVLGYKGDTYHGKPKDAIKKLVGKGNKTVTFICSKIQPVLDLCSEKGVNQLILELDDDQWEVRCRATDRLTVMGRWADPYLRSALRKTQSAEVRARLEPLILDNEDPFPDSAGRLQFIRSVAILERIATPEAKALLKSIEAAPIRPFVRWYSTNICGIEAGFVPDKVEYIWGEPMFYISFVLRHHGYFIQFPEIADIRSVCEVSVKDSNGKTIQVKTVPKNDSNPKTIKLGRYNPPNPDSNLKYSPWDSRDRKWKPRGASEKWQKWSYNGYVGRGIFIQMLPLAGWLEFPGPGTYTITCKTPVKAAWSSKTADLPEKISFKVTIHPYSKERMSEVIANLEDHIQATNGMKPKILETGVLGGLDFKMTQANHLSYAYAALTRIKDEQSASVLKKLTKDKPEALKTVQEWADTFFVGNR
jgi:hypothetical protein